MREKIVVVTLPTLRLDWIESEMPAFAALSRGWRRAAIEPVFPGLTCPAHATLTTGASPREHGIVANGVFHRDTREPEMWVFRDPAIRARRLWEDATAAGRRAGAFLLLNINEARADCFLLPKPVHHDDGTMSMWCAHKPEGLYPELVKTMGHFNLMKFWGPMAGIESSRWIATAARRAILELDLDLSFVYLPHTDYAPQKFGPESDAARRAHRELDAVLSGLIGELHASGRGFRFVVVSEYGITEVSRHLLPNVLLREAGLLSVVERDDVSKAGPMGGGGVPLGPREFLDYAGSRAFAMADHQIAHVYVRDAGSGDVARGDLARARAVFEGRPEIETVASGDDIRALGLDPERSGELVLVARRDAWFAYPWWTDFARAPGFAKTIDIHAKPGYDPLEMYWDAAIGGTAQDPTLVRGSHGAFARDPDQKAALVTDLPGLEGADSTAAVGRALRARLHA